MTVSQLINEVCGTELQVSVRSTVQETNSVLAGCKVHYIFRGSIVDLETGKNGLRWLIVRILKDAQAEFPRFNHEGYKHAIEAGNEAGNSSADEEFFRPIYLSYGLTSEDIIDRIRAINGADKYPDQAILDVLSTVLADEVDSIRMSNSEDSDRNSKANQARRLARGKSPIARSPRCKFYLIAH